MSFARTTGIVASSSPAALVPPPKDDGAASDRQLPQVALIEELVASTYRGKTQARSSNSPSLTPAMNAFHSSPVKRETGASGSLVLPTTTNSP